jgi:hypothetical protein
MSGILLDCKRLGDVINSNHNIIPFDRQENGLEYLAEFIPRTMSAQAMVAERSRRLPPEIFANFGIVPQFSASNQQYQHRTAEKAVGDVTCMVRTTMLSSKAPKRLWDWAFKYACHVKRPHNTATLAVANGNDFTHETVKHVTVKVQFIQECVRRKIILLAPIRTFQNISDIMTKQSTGTQYLLHRDYSMGMSDGIDIKVAAMAAIADIQNGQRRRRTRKRIWARQECDDLVMFW